MIKEGRKPENLIGISHETLLRRGRRNIITLTGQFLSFVIEFMYSMAIYTLLVENDGYLNGVQFLSGTFITAMITLSFFLSSPELRRHYFN